MPVASENIFFQARQDRCRFAVRPNDYLLSPPFTGVSLMKILAIVVLALWLGLVLLLGATGAFVSPPGAPPLGILIGAAAPLAIFLAGYWGSASFHRYVLAIDLPLVTAIQAWRAGGLGFLALYVHGVLPGVFAWPAGLGDIAIGVAAPWLAVALVRRPAFATSRVFVVWNLLGILDLVVAVGVGGLNSALASGLTGEVTTGPMATLPLVLIPAYLVPLFIILHLAALFQARRLALADRSGEPVLSYQPGYQPVGIETHSY
jgi:hypothetical protein